MGLPTQVIRNIMVDGDVSDGLEKSGGDTPLERDSPEKVIHFPRGATGRKRPAGA